MRVALCADVHIGNHKVHGGGVVAGVNRRCSLVLDSLRKAYAEAMRQQCSAMIIAGDLFDVANPPPQHLAAVQDILKDARTTRVQTFILLGNHDMVSAEKGDHALGPLRPYAKIIDTPQKVFLSEGKETLEMWLVPFMAGPADEWFPAVLDEMAKADPPTSTDPHRLLAFHLGIQDAKTPPWLVGSYDSIHVDTVLGLLDMHSIKAAFAGNWHSPQSWNRRRIVQIGALTPTGFDNPGVGIGTMAVYDTQSQAACATIEIPGPRFLTNMDDAKDAADAGCIPFVRLSGGPDTPKIKATLEAIGATVDVLPDTAEAQAAFRSAAGAVRSAESVDEAVAAYVSQMPLDDATLRPLVLEKVTQFLRGAS